MTGITLYIADNIQSTSQLVEGSKLDLYDNELINFIFKIKDITDISSNFSDFTKDFVIPPTKNNKKLLKYWHDVLNNNQFEKFQIIPAQIDIDGFFFREGGIKILKSELDSDGNLKNYTIQFVSDMGVLKEIFGDKKIGDLPYGNLSEIAYRDQDVLARLENTTKQAIMFPIISTTRTINDYSAIKFTTGLNNPLGLRKNDLRPAISCAKIMEAICNNFKIRVRGDIFDQLIPESSLLDNIYLWLNKNTNPFTQGGSLLKINGQPNVAVDYYDHNVPTKDDFFTISNKPRPFTYYFQIELQLSVTNVNDSSKFYGIKLQEVILFPNNTVNEQATLNQINGGIIAQTANFSSGIVNNVLTHILYYDKNITKKQSFRWVGFAKEGDEVALTNLSMNIIGRTKITSSDLGATAVQMNIPSTSSTFLVNRFNINSNLPEMTVIDFFTSFLKMFNLVVIPTGSKNYTLKYYNDYYATGEVYDITKYMTKSVKINRIATYKAYDFKFDENDYVDNVAFGKSQSNSRKFGNISEKSNGDLDKYEVASKFNVLIFKELGNISYVSISDKKWLIANGVSENNSLVNKPTIFYFNGITTVPSNRNISYNIDNTSSALSRFAQFSNVNNDGNTLLFSSEIIGTNINNNSLYNIHYDKLIKYINSKFSREYEYVGFLPKYIYTTLSLNSQIIISNITYSIAEINIDLISGKTTMKLNNKIL